MDNSNTASNNLLQSLNSSSEGISISGESSNSFIGWIKSIPIITWVLIIIVLAFLGINVFSYLAKGSQDATNIFKPLIDSIGGAFSKLTGQIVNVTAEGAKDVINTTAGVANSGLTDIQNVSQGSAPSASMATSTNTGVPVQSTVPSPSESQTNALNTALNSPTLQPQPQSQLNQGQSYQADDANSTIQSAGSGKAGWCYIGEEHGIRTCGEVGVNDTCMSGDIFPSQEICINPSLRA